MVMIRRAVVAVLVMIVAFPVVVMVTGEVTGGSLVGEALGGVMLAYASLPVIGVVLVVGCISKPRPMVWAVVVGGVIAVVFAATLYHAVAGPGVFYWWVAATAGLLVLWRR
jgi:hypothetical protein